MQAVAVRRFDDDVIARIDGHRVAQKRLVEVAKVAGKYDFFHHTVFGDMYLYAGGAEQMPRVRKMNSDSRAKLKRLIVRVGHKKLNCADGVVHGIERNKLLAARALGFAVSPFGFKHLNVRTVAKHDVAQIARGLGGVNLPVKAPGVQQGEQPGMVDVRVSEQNIVDVGGLNGDFLVLVHILALLHAVVNQNVLAAGGKITAASGHFAGGADKGQFHVFFPPVQPPAEFY